MKDILDYSLCSTFSFLTSLSSPEFLPPLQRVAQIWDFNSDMSPYLNMSASQTPPESSTVALGWVFSFPQQALFLPALGSVPCFTTRGQIHMNHLPWSFFPVSGCKLSCSPSSVVWQVPPGQGPVLIFAVLEQLLYLPHSCNQTFPGSKLWQQEQLLAHCTCSWWLRAPAGVMHKVAATVIFCCFLSLMPEGSWRFFLSYQCHILPETA